MHRSPRFFIPLAVLLSAVLLLAACTDDTTGDQPEQSSAPPEGDFATLGTGEPVGIDRVIDGDSVNLLVGDTLVEARIEGLNAAELYDANDELTCAGVNGRESLDAFLASGPVLASGEETDRFGRRLVTLEVNGQSAASQLIGQGWALASGEVGGTNHDLMLRAADSGLGMWGPDGCGTPLVDTIRIGDRQLDPPGSDSDNLAEEWVAVTNIGPAPVDLTGWTLRDRTTSNQYVFGAIAIPPDGSVQVRTGQGTNTATDLYWGESFPVWNNQDEVILVVDPQGVIVDWWFATT